MRLNNFNPSITAQEFKTWLEENTSIRPLTIQNYFYVVRRFLNRLYKPVPTLQEINQFLLDYERNEVFGSQTVKAALKYYCRMIGQDHLLDHIKPLRNVSQRKKPASDVTFSELVKALPYFKNQACKDVFALQLQSGARQMEIWLCEADQVRYNATHATLQVVQKGGESNVIIIPDVELAKTIFNREAYRGKKYPFLARHCQRLTRFELQEGPQYAAVRKYYWRDLRQACKRAGITSYGSHDARRAVLRAVGDINKAKVIARHKDIRTTARYFEGAPVDIVEVLRGVQE